MTALVLTVSILIVLHIHEANLLSQSLLLSKECRGYGLINHTTSPLGLLQPLDQERSNLFQGEHIYSFGTVLSYESRQGINRQPTSLGFSQHKWVDGATYNYAYSFLRSLIVPHE